MPKHQFTDRGRQVQQHSQKQPPVRRPGSEVGSADSAPVLGSQRSSAAHMLMLQRTIGNRAVQRQISQTGQMPIQRIGRKITPEEIEDDSLSRIQKIKNGIQKINRGIEDEDKVKPVKQKSAFVDVASVHEYAGQILHGMEAHQHAMQKDALLLQEDQFALKERSAKLEEQRKKAEESLGNVKEPTGIFAGLKKNASKQTDTIRKKIEEYIKEKEKNDKELELTNARVERAEQIAASVFADSASVMMAYLGIKGIHKDVKSGAQVAAEMMPLVAGNVQKMAEIERDTVEKRKAITKDANEVRKTGRSATLIGGIAKTVLASVMSAGLSLLTAGYLKVEKKSRGGDYSSTFRVSTGKERFNKEFTHLTAIINANTYGNRNASQAYAIIKTISTNIIVPARNLIAWLSLVTGLAGTALTSAALVTLGTAAAVGAPLLAISSVLSLIGIGLTGLNALINGALFVWNLVREKLLQNEAKRAILRGETIGTGITAVTEAVSAAASSGVVVYKGDPFVRIHTKLNDLAYTKTEESLRTLWGYEKPTKTVTETVTDFMNQIPSAIEGGIKTGAPTGIKEGIKTGTSIGTSVFKSKAKPAEMAKMQEEKGTLLTAPHKSRGPKIVRAKKYLGELQAKIKPTQDEVLKIAELGNSIMKPFRALKQITMNIKAKLHPEVSPEEMEDHADTANKGADVSDLLVNASGQMDEAFTDGFADLQEQVERDDEAELADVHH
ncbi:hypothetical protein EKD04_019210 [Chloroflexales bacterium ZM16-3]|nr:hypothetical protein [Chloroflexales bacterium ZM16-3]